MKPLIQFYRSINLLSIDVALGAVACSAFFAQVLNIQLRISGLIALGLTVWAIYAVDHLLDARKIGGDGTSARHRFHKKYFKFIALTVIGVVLVDLFAVTFVRTSVMQSGIKLSVVVGLYLLLQQRLRMVKELSAAILYCSGVWLAPLTVYQGEITESLVALMIQFGLTAFINLLLFSLFDLPTDIKQGQHSLARSIGEGSSRLLLAMLFAVNLSTPILQIVTMGLWWMPALVVLSMNLVLLVIYLNPGYFLISNRFRLAGDAVFFIPFLYLEATRFL